MTAEAQRIAIAEACGWLLDHINRSAMYYVPSRDCHVGDPLSDLNAMHEAEEVVLSQGLQDSWLDTLVEVVVGENIHWSDYHCFPQVNRATAAQRCEAFLRTINKWKND